MVHFILSDAELDVFVASRGLTDSAVDDDPKCARGVHRSEHALCGCPDGFQSPASWAAESKTIAGMSDAEFESWYGGN